MKRIPFPLVKIINVLVAFLPFMAVWYRYYEPLTMTVYSRQVSVLMLAIYCLIFYYLCHVLDGFRVGILRIREIIMSQILAVAITDVAAFVIIWMLSIHFPHMGPGLLTLAVQAVLLFLWTILMHKWYISAHEPLKTALVYDARQGMKEVIRAYGVGKSFRVVRDYALEEIMDDLDALADMDAVFLCDIHSHERNILLKYCTEKNIQLYIIPRVGDVLMSAAERMHMFHLPILYSHRYNPPTEYKTIKRGFDILCSGLGLIVFSPIMLAVWLAVRSDGGPAIYRQKRLTKDGKVFEILKFRSMRVDAEKTSGAVLSAGETDPRITKVGRFIRACRLDELPQLINILKGEMSIVGPRPERPEIAAEYEKELPEFRLRLQTKAGLTGYAQVYGKYNTTPYDKLLMDLMYIAHPGILEDISIILATLKILTSKESTEGVAEGQVTAPDYENSVDITEKQGNTVAK